MMVSFNEVRKILTSTLLRGAFWGVLGQFFTFLLMVLPIFWGATTAISVLVLWGGVASIGANFFSYGANVVIPTRKHSMQVYVAAVYSTVSLAIGSFALFLLILFPVSLTFLSPIHIISSSLLLFCQGAYLISSAVLVRIGDYNLISLLRFYYGVLSTLFTAVFLFFSSSVDACLLWAMSLAYLISVLWVVFELINRYPGGVACLRRVKYRYSYGVCYFRRHWRLAFSLLISNMAFNASSLSVAKLGPIGGFWAIILRLTGGVCTVGSQIFAPAFEMAISSVVRSGEYHGAKKIYINVLGSGFFFAFCI